METKKAKEKREESYSDDSLKTGPGPREKVVETKKAEEKWEQSQPDDSIKTAP